MKPFLFRLKTVAKVRRIEMEQQAKIVALAMADVIRARDELQNYLNDEVKEVARLQELSSFGNFQETLWHLSKGYLAGLKLTIAKTRESIIQLERKVESERTKLIEKQRRKQALEKLEARGRTAYEAQIRDMERKEMDETANGRFMERSRSDSDEGR